MTDSQNQWVALEHQVYRMLKAEEIERKKCLLAVSGGADSVALLLIFQKLSRALNLTLGVVVCHHGPPQDPNQVQEKEQFFFRNHAVGFVQNLSRDLSRDLNQEPLFYLVESPKPLSSEEEMRDFRKSEIEKIREREGFDFTVWAHHQEDFLETQILRLIRGSGPEALFEPMLFLRGPELRPLLKVSKQVLKEYLEKQRQEWLEDPSNQNETYLRNWIRNTWLPQLEEKCPGALKSFSRSLALLQESLKEEDIPGLWLDQGLSRPVFLTLSVSQKKQIIARYLKKQGQSDFSHNQIEEVIKHLDISQLNHTFQCAGLRWNLSRDLISATALLL